MEEVWYNDFINSTGFAQERPEADTAPVHHGQQQLARDFQGMYDSSNTNPPRAALGAPGSAVGQKPFVPGTLPEQDHLAPQAYKAPYDTNTLINETNGLQPSYPTQQKNWVTPGVWKNDTQDPALETKPGSGPIPGSKKTGGFKVQTKPGPPLSLASEKMLAVSGDQKRNMQIAAGVLAGVGVLSGAVYASKSQRLANPSEERREKQYLGVAGVSILGAVVLALLAGTSNVTGSKEPQKGEALYDGNRRVLQDTNFAPPVMPIQADQPLPKPYPNLHDPQDDIQSRYALQGVNTDLLEGPRANMGYRRAPPTPDGRGVLPSSELMRQPGNYNMDQGTYDEYMRSLNGEAPPRLVASHPYYTFNAQFENRAQIDESAKYFGIADQPGQMLRKSLYREPKINQAGAKRMHLKDPPPGSNPPLGKVHPAMETDESGGPAFFASPGDEHLVAERSRGMEIVQLPDDEEKHVTKGEAHNLFLDRMHKIEPPKADKGFMTPEQTMSERKMRKNGLVKNIPLSEQPQEEREFIPPSNSAPPAEPLELERGRYPVPENQQPRSINVNGPPQRVEGFEIHETGQDGEDSGSGSPEDMFSAAFTAAAAPPEEVVEQALRTVQAR